MKILEYKHFVIPFPKKGMVYIYDSDNLTNDFLVFTTLKRATNYLFLNKIPDWEFENLAKKSLRILKELYENPHFTNEGDFAEREKRYEERSNPIIRFVEEECEEKPGYMITLRDFTNKCNEYLKENHLRVMNSNQIGKILRSEGFIVGNRVIDDISAVVIVNLNIKNMIK